MLDAELAVCGACIRACEIENRIHADTVSLRVVPPESRERLLTRRLRVEAKVPCGRTIHIGSCSLGETDMNDLHTSTTTLLALILGKRRAKQMYRGSLVELF